MVFEYTIEVEMRIVQHGWFLGLNYDLEKLLDNTIDDTGAAKSAPSQGWICSER